MSKIFNMLLLLWAMTLTAQNNLDYYVSTAKKNSALINDNKNQDKANQLEIQRLKAFYTKPQVGLTANYLFAPVLSTDNNATNLLLNPVNATNYYGYEIGATNGGQYQAMLNVSQPIFNGSRYKTSANLSQVNSQLNQNNIKLTEHDLEKMVTDQYILCMQDKKQLLYLTDMISVLEGQRSILAKLIESSIYKKADGLLLDIEYDNYSVQLSAAKANYNKDILDLYVICGIPDTTPTNIQDESLILSMPTSGTGFIKKFDLDSLSLSTQQKIIELKYKPQLFAFANTGLNAAHIDGIGNRFGLSAGLSLSYTFFDGRQRKITRDKTNVLTSSIDSYKTLFENQNTVRKKNILEQLDTYPARISLFEKQLKEYDSLLANYRKEIMSGQLTIINYITALRNKLTLQRDYNLLVSQQQLLINTYNYWNW